MSRPDSCSVDFGRETPKFRFEFCGGFFGGFFPPIFSKEKGQKKSTKKSPRKIHPGLCSEKFPSDFCRSLFLKKCIKKLEKTEKNAKRPNRPSFTHAQVQAPPSYGSGRYGLEFSGPRIPFCATGALWRGVMPFAQSLF